MYLKKTANIILKDYDGKVPNEYGELMKLSGVGEKMALLAMDIAFKKNIGISVDTHVHRVSNRLGVVKTKIPPKTVERNEFFLILFSVFDILKLLSSIS